MLFRLQAGLLFLLAAPAAAQQIFINSMWVSHPKACSVVIDSVNSGVARFYCRGPASNPPSLCPSGPLAADGGNISNNPNIQFDQFLTAATELECQQANTGARNPNFAAGSTYHNYCNSRVMLCLNIGFTNSQSGATDIAIDKVAFEVFKFTGGANALNPETTPPVRTFSIDAPGTIRAQAQPGLIPSPTDCNTAGFGNQAGCGYCVLWDGTINIAGELGKSNGQYGFRGTVETNQTGANGNVNITQTRPYPSGATFDCRVCRALGAGDSVSGTCTAATDCNVAACEPTGAVVLPGIVLQQPVTVDVVNVHNVRSSATIVGNFSGVLAQPYSVTYRLGKDATTYVTIQDTGSLPPRTVRKLVDGLPRVGEGVPDGTLQNGDAWNGRFENGDLGPPGVYLVTIQAAARDQYGFDLASPVTRQISLDPLQITDILVQPLTGLATSLAVLTYTLTEPATVYLDIYPPGTQFCNGLNNLNDVNTIPDAFESAQEPGKHFRAALGPCGNTTDPPSLADRRIGLGAGDVFTPTGSLIRPIRRIVEQKDFRKAVVSFWDGRDSNGNIMPDGDFVFLLYAALPTQNGFAHRNQANDRRVWTTTAKSGFLTIARGFVTISQVT
ncbi:MAG: hypothetical protein HY553_00645, partial [Elusimicrobia bacterium]|nr:hypothetical protein [Elusimicrobiota bacterium]